MFESLTARAGGDAKLVPMIVAHDPLLTAREKLDRLHEMLAEALGEAPNRHDLGYSPEEVAEAIAKVRAGVQGNVGAQTVLRGDF